MNDVEVLLKKYRGKRVWFDLHDEMAKEHFKKQLLDLNAKWQDGSQFEKEDNPSNFMAIHEDYVIAIVNGLSWLHSFHLENDDYVRIDYKKYIDGQDDYLITKPNITYLSCE